MGHQTMAMTNQSKRMTKIAIRKQIPGSLFQYAVKQNSQGRYMGYKTMVTSFATIAPSDTNQYPRSDY